jgi:hypothetical protein
MKAAVQSESMVNGGITLLTIKTGNLYEVSIYRPTDYEVTPDPIILGHRAHHVYVKLQKRFLHGGRASHTVHWWHIRFLHLLRQIPQIFIIFVVISLFHLVPGSSHEKYAEEAIVACHQWVLRRI